MQNYNKFFLPYVPKAQVNYIYLFYFYGIATRFEEKQIIQQWQVKDEIVFSNFGELEQRINKKYANSEKDSVVSAATLRRVALSDKYNSFIHYDKNYYGKQGIILNNCFVGDKGKKSPFVVLNPKTYNFLIQQDDNLLAKYTIFIKYQCGRNGGKTDFTANQFFEAFGYSTKSNSGKDKVCEYNRLLVEKGIVSIQKIRKDGKERNIYTFVDE